MVGSWSRFVGLGALSGFGLAGLAGYLGAGFWLVSGFLGWLVVFCIVVRVSVMLVFLF